MAKRCRIGDIIEIPTKAGLAYAQYSHHHAEMSALLRILPGDFPSRPEELASVISAKERFFVFFPLQAAVNQGVFEVVANLPVPTAAQAFPVFRTAWPDLRTGKALQWFLWYGEKSWKVESLTAETRKLSPKEIYNDTMLIRRIETGWTPEASEE
jgi:hypothetical protein